VNAALKEYLILLPRVVPKTSPFNTKLSCHPQQNAGKSASLKEVPSLVTESRSGD